MERTMIESSNATVLHGGYFKGAQLPSTDPETIYYIQTHTPHVGDFSFFGPFREPDEAEPSIRNKLQEASPVGHVLFDEMISSRQDGLASFDHLDVPLAGGRTMTLKLLKEKNAEVKATLPGPSWLVLIAEQSPIRSSADALALDSFTIHGAFVSVERANKAAWEILAGKVRTMPGARTFEEVKSDRSLNCGIISRKKSVAIEVKFETGNIVSPGYIKEPNCSACQRPQSTFLTPLKNCSRCRATKYCSKECQKSDWKTHKRVCTTEDLEGSSP